MSAIAGRRIVVTRATHQADELTHMLEARGGLVERVPLIAIEDPTDGGAALARSMSDLGTYAWLVVTSPNGARRVAEGLAAARAAGRAPRVAVVGAATAAALGHCADLVARRPSGAGLVADFPDGSGRVLVVQADRAGDAVADGLRGRGWDVDVVVAYRTIAQRPDGEARDRALAADAVVFASGSAVEAWVEAFGRSTPPIVVAIGPSTAAAARAQTLQVAQVAADQTLESLLEALEAALERSL